MHQDPYQVDSPLPSEAQRRSSHNILIVGDSGVGENSVVGLIAGETLAAVHSGASASKVDTTSCDIILPDNQGLNHHIRLFDTIGLSESQLGKTDYLMAIEKAHTLVCQLQRMGGIRLLVLCFCGGRITAVMRNNYRLFCDILCQNKVPVAFIITGLENEPSMEGWWANNVQLFEAYCLSCASHACVTATRGLNDCYAESYRDSQITVRAMLLEHVSGQSIHLAGTRSTLVHTKLRDPPPTYDASPRNIIIFGETGIGKSSVVNLVAGQQLAETSSKARACTLAFNPYHIVLQGNQPFCIWDTVGLNGPGISCNDYLLAIKQACELIKELERSSGIHLLLLCIERGRITKLVQQNYKLLVKVLCETKVPLGIVLNHLENEPRMEDWWTANKDVFEKYGISAEGHACITSSPGVGSMFLDQYEESRESMRKLVLELTLPNEWRQQKDTQTRFVDALEEVASMLPLRRSKELRAKLIECGYSRKDVAAIAAVIEAVRDQISKSTPWPLPKLQKPR